MPRLLPDVLFPSADFSLAELSAARLDGELTAVDEGFTPVDRPETMLVRLQAIAPLLAGRVIVERQSALWVYGLRPLPPLRHEGCVPVGARFRQPSTARLQIREVILGEGDVTRHPGGAVTSLLRTAIDLARTTPRFGASSLAQLTAVIDRAGLTLEQCLAHLESANHLPHKIRAADRLRAAFRASAAADAVDVVHRIDAPHGVQHTIEVGRVTHLEHETADREAVA